MSQTLYNRDAIAPVRLPRYTLTAQWLHWLTAACILAVLPLAWLAVNVPPGPAKGVLFTWHKSFGITIFVLIAARILWRAFHHAPPDTAEPTALTVIARINHWLLYAIFIVMPVSGFLLSAWGGRPTSYFFLFTIPALPPNPEASALADRVHLLGQWMVYALVGLHLLATAFHVLIRRDYTLERMLPEQDPSTVRSP